MNKMDKKNKIWLAVGIVAGLCMCAAVVSFLVFREMGSRMRNAFKTEPGDIAAVSNSIAKFDVPPGYELSMAMSFFNYDVVSMMPSSSTSTDMMIMMMQFSSMTSVNQEQMLEAFKQQSNQPNVQMKVVEQRTEMIRGEEVTVTVSESTSSETFTMRQWMTVFKGNNGPTMLMIQGSTAGWDEELIKDFIESIE